MFVTFQNRRLNHLEMYRILTIEAWLNLNINFGYRYLELWTACIISLVFTVLNFRDEIESKYPSIVFSEYILWKHVCLLTKIDLVNIAASKECLKVYMLPSFGEGINIPVIKRKRSNVIFHKFTWASFSSNSRLFSQQITCADPESFVRGGPTLIKFFLVYEGRDDPADHHRPASEMPFKWRFAGVPMMAQHWILAW